MTFTSKTAAKNFNAAIDLLKGKTVVAHDRRAAEATAIDFTTRRAKGVVIIRPSYGVSNTMQKALTALADAVEFVGGMPEYHFAK